MRPELRTEWLRILLSELNLSQNEAARLIDMEPRAFLRWCNPKLGKPPPWVVCDYFHCMLSQLIPAGHVVNRNAHAPAKATDDASDQR
jgi:hypothetical protein